MFESYQQSRWGRRYGYRDPIYAKGYHRGQDLRAQNAAGTASVVADVHTLSAGTVVYVGRPNNSLGMTVVVDTGRSRGRYESHSHMAGVIVKVGQKVTADQKLGRNARMNENPGMVTGVHDHMTITDHLDGAWNTARPEYDPLPFIRDALTTAAGTGGDPLTPEEDMPITEHDARLIARTLLEWSSPGLEESSGGPIPRETIARRLRVIRAHTNGLPARLEAQNAALAAAVKTLAESGGLDPAVVTAAIDKAVNDALGAWTLSITRPEPADTTSEG